MSREIKFRAWGPNSRHMWSWEGLTELVRELGDNGEKILMQYTGLKDKNGTEIYEGDILCHKVVPPGFVEFADGSFVFNQGETNQGLNRLCMDRTKRLGIIGNIYENPELLENNHE